MLTLTKLTIIIEINRFDIIVNFRNRFDKAVAEIFQFCMALVEHTYENKCVCVLVREHTNYNIRIIL